MGAGGRGPRARTRVGKGQAAVQPLGRREEGGHDLPGALRPPGLPPGRGGPSLPRATNLTAPEGDSADRPPCTGPGHQRRPRNPPAPSPARPRAACLARDPGSRAAALASPLGAPLPAPEPACEMPGTSTPSPRRRGRRPSYPGSRAPAARAAGSEPCPSQPRPAGVTHGLRRRREGVVTSRRPDQRRAGCGPVVAMAMRSRHLSRPGTRST